MIRFRIGVLKLLLYREPTRPKSGNGRGLGSLTYDQLQWLLEVAVEASVDLLALRATNRNIGGMD